MANAWGITELTDAQSAKYATVNMMIRYLTAYLTGARDIASGPPASPVENAMYVIGPGGNTGAWSSFSVNDLVFYFGSTWYRITPVEGMCAWVWDEDTIYDFNGTSWTARS